MSETHKYATAQAVSGLASEVEGLRKRLDAVDGRVDPERLGRVEEQVLRLVEEVGQLATRPGHGEVQSWLALDEDTELAGMVLAELTRWLCTVFLRFPDAAAVLPECWAWHPEVIEELLWLMQAWSVAYFDEAGGVLRVADWHDRYRPGVVRRLRDGAGKCSLENHTPPKLAPSVPLSEMTGPLAEWWGSDRASSAPEPTEEQFAAVPKRGGGRR